MRRYAFVLLGLPLAAGIAFAQAQAPASAQPTIQQNMAKPLRRSKSKVSMRRPLTPQPIPASTSISTLAATG